MRTPLIAAALASVTLAGCTTYGDGYGPRDRYANGYDYARDYRDGSYEPYALGPDDTIYRGGDGRYYCKRHDGTVGLVVGAGVGAILGNVIAPRGSKTLGAILGGAAGAAVGASVDRDVSCR
ncbi:MAG: surface antigen [Alphaproteobacteria bacterium]|nr:surface antigen [Alphaproteobacteria bacterium]